MAEPRLEFPYNRHGKASARILAGQIAGVLHPNRRVKYRQRFKLQTEHTGNGSTVIER